MISRISNSLLSKLIDSSKLLTEVQDELISLMVKDITEQIFNATVANW